MAKTEFPLLLFTHLIFHSPLTLSTTPTLYPLILQRVILLHIQHLSNSHTYFLTTHPHPLSSSHLAVVSLSQLLQHSTLLFYKGASTYTYSIYPTPTHPSCQLTLNHSLQNHFKVLQFTFSIFCFLLNVHLTHIRKVLDVLANYHKMKQKKLGICTTNITKDKMGTAR